MDRFLETHEGRQTTELNFYELGQDHQRHQLKSNCDQTGRGVHVLALPEQQVSR